MLEVVPVEITVVQSVAAKNAGPSLRFVEVLGSDAPQMSVLAGGGTVGTTTIYVTHDQMEAMTLATRIAVMNKGVIQQLDVPERIYDDPANLFVAGFIGSPAMNLIRGQLTNGSFHAEGITVAGVGGDTREGIGSCATRAVYR